MMCRELAIQSGALAFNDAFLANSMLISGVLFLSFGFLMGSVRLPGPATNR